MKRKSDLPGLDNNDSQLSQSGATGKLNPVFILACSFIVLVIVLAWLALDRVEEKIREDLGETLQTILQTTQEALNLWVDNEKFHLSQLAENPRLVQLVQRQLLVSRNTQDLLERGALIELQAFFYRNKGRYGQAEFYIIAPDFMNVASMVDEEVGTDLLALGTHEVIEKAFGGKTVFVHPIRADEFIHSYDADELKTDALIFLAAPIKDRNGEVAAVLVRPVDPSNDFARIHHLGRIGKTGETYAFDRNGMLVSESRFDNDLRRIGLIGEDERGILSISVRDPGGNLLEGFSPLEARFLQPLTLNAGQAIKGESGVDVQGYRDYRGVQVCGAWLWDRDLNIGLTTEIDEAEALSPYYTARNAILTVLGITVLLALGSILFAALIQERANRALQKSHHELENRVQERTAELSASEERFALAVRGAGAGIWDLDPRTGKAWYSERFKQLLEYGDDEFEDAIQSWENSLHPDDREAALEALQNHLHHRSTYLGEYRLRDKFGDYRWFRATGQALWDDSGEAIRMAGSIIDVTERKVAEEGLRKLSRATEKSPASVVITDRNGNIEYVNPTFCEVTGYSAQEAIGQNPRVLKSGNLPKLFYKNLWDTILSGRTWKGDFINKKKSGEEFWEHASISPIKNEQGEITHFVAVKQDITARKQMEKELVEARRDADEANKAKGDFLANMSHEIRTPMNAVIGMAHLALKTELTSRQRDYLTKIQMSANALLGIINDILDFSKIEAGKLDMESIDFDLDDVLNNLANLVTVKAQEKKDLEVLFATGQDVPRFLVGDPLRLGQVLINLSNNAVKFTNSGEIVVSTELLEKDNGSVTLKFSVRDSGIGLTQEQVGRLFEAFSQADASTTRQYGGTGLGLTISKRLVEMMGGNIWVESEPGRGSTFSFTADFSARTEETQKTFVPSPDLRGIRVLVVDDNATSRTILQDLLESFSFEVALAASGEEGLSELVSASENRPFDLVIMDWRMPVMDGLEASRRIKELDLQTSPPVILVTAYGREELMQETAKIGLAGFLLKPVNPSVLFDTIMQAFGRKTPGESHIYREKDAEAAVLKELAGARVLLAEDNEINQQVAREILEGAGLNVSIANDGEEALRAVQENSYDAVLMDIQMPVMDGHEATKRIRSNPQFHDLPIIAMTAHAMARDQQRSLEAGMNDHVTKPIDPAQLFAALRKWIPAREGREEHSRAEIKTPDVSEPPFPESLPGFDLAAGLKRLRGNVGLYKKLLGRFATDYSEAAGDIRAALNARDMDRAHGLVHSLKGVAGNLAATDLQEAAIGLEKLVKGAGQGGAPSHEDLETKLASLEKALNQVLASVQPLVEAPGAGLAVEAPADAVASLPSGVIGDVAARLRAAAEIGDVTKLIAVTEELKAQSDALGPFCDRIVQLARDFDFEGVAQVVLDLDSDV